MAKSPARYLLLLLAAMLALLPLVLILRDGVDVRYWDEWDPDLADVYIKAHDHSLTLTDLSGQHNEHRPLVPRLVYLAISPITHINNIGEQIAGWMVVCLTSAGVLILCCRTAHPIDPATAYATSPVAIAPPATIAAPLNRPTGRTLADVAHDKAGANPGTYLPAAYPSAGSDAVSLPVRSGLDRAPLALPAAPYFSDRAIVRWLLCNVAIFGLGQITNWFLGIGLINFMPMLFITAAIVVAGSKMRQWPMICLLIISSTAATFSSGNGMLCWPLVMLLVAWSGSKRELRRKAWALSALLTGFAANLLLYFHNFTSTATYVFSPKLIALYNLVFLGNLYGWTTAADSTTNCMIMGALQLILLAACIVYFVYLWRKSEFQLCGQMLIWISVAAFAVLSSLMASFSRASFGVDQAGASRYASFSLYLSVALINLIAIICVDLQARFPRAARPVIQFPAFLAAAMLVLTLAGLPRISRYSQELAVERRRQKAALLLANIFPEHPILAGLYHPPVNSMISEANQFSLIGDLNPPMITDRHAALIEQKDLAMANGIEGGLEQCVQADSNHVFVTGWGFQKRPHRVLDSIFLTYDDQNHEPIILAMGLTNQARPDMAQRTGDAAYSSSGWSVGFPIADLPADLKNTEIHAWELDITTGKAVRLDGKFVITR